MSYQGIYKIGLQEVEVPENKNDRYGKSTVVSFEEEGVLKYMYEDSLIKITWIPMTSQFGFSLLNKTNHSIKIIWDEAVYVNEKGLSQKVFHSGVKYVDKNNAQPPTVIVKNATVEDLIVPTDNVYYVSGKYGGWRTKPLLQNSAMTSEELDQITKDYIGKNLQILLPLEIEGEINEYLFTFKIEDFIKK